MLSLVPAIFPSIVLQEHHSHITVLHNHLHFLINCALMNYLVHIIQGITSSTPMNLNSAEIMLSGFSCFDTILIGLTQSNIIPLV